MVEMNVEVELTKPVTNLEAVFSSCVKSLKEKYEKQGTDIEYVVKVAKGGASLAVKIKSNKLVTATDAIVQLEKQLAAALGKEFKVGIKNIKVIDYEVVFDLEEAPKKAITIPFVAKVGIKGKQATLRYENFNYQWVKDNYVERTIKLVKDKITQMNYEGKDEFKEVVWEGKPRQNTYKGDPAEDLEKMNWIKRTPAKGQFVYGREFTALVNVVRELIAEEIYEPLNFQEMLLPKFEPWVIPQKSGHAKNIYPNAYFVMNPKNASPEYWEEVMDKYAITREIPLEEIKQKADCTGIMSYAQCPPFWPYLEGKVIDEGTLPLKIFDWSGPTYRNESGGTHGIDRLEEFHRIETLTVGTKIQVIDAWQKLKGAFTKFFDETLDIEIRVCKVTPWWMAHAGIKTEKGTDEMGTYDFDAYLPYRGNRDKEWLEIQNDSSNGDKYPTAFRVKGKNQEYLWSGCAGGSFERILCAFLAQKGLDPQNWPAEIRKRFETKMKNVKPLKFY